VARRLLAARLVRLLQPAAVACGAFASAEVTVRLGGVHLRPAAAVAPDPPPPDGLLRAPPLLVAELAWPSPGPVDPAAWLERGVRTVWVIAEGTATIWTPRGLLTLGGTGMLAVSDVPGLAVPLAPLFSWPLT
jgi:hypothetical protein